MRRLLPAVLTGIAMTMVTVVVVASLRGHREPDEKPRVERSSPVIVAPPPRQPERAPSRTAAMRAATQSTELLAPASVAEPLGVSGLVDAHPGASLTRSFPSLGIGEVRQSLRAGREQRVDQEAKPISRPAPSYPAEARRKRLEGFVRVRLRVDARGSVVDAVVVESEPVGVFDEVALSAARRYRFEPARRDERAVESTLEQRIVFRLQR